MRSTSARRRLVAGDDRRRIAGRDIEQAEDAECDDQHHRNGGQDAADDVGEHRVGSLISALAWFMPTPDAMFMPG